MKIINDSVKELAIKDFPWKMPGLFLGIALAMFVRTVAGMLDASFGLKEIIGGSLGTFVGVLGFVLFCKYSEFRFDLVSRSLVWRRRGVFVNESGHVNFNKIKPPVVEVSSGGMHGTNTATTYRIMLHTEAYNIPLTQYYSGDKERVEQLAQRLREILGGAPEDLTNESVENLVRQNRHTDAVRLLRETRGLSLTQAHDLAKKIKGEIK